MRFDDGGRTSGRSPGAFTKPCTTPGRSVSPVAHGFSLAISWNRWRSVHSLADAMRSTSAISSGGDATSRSRSAANTCIAASASAIARCRFVKSMPRWSAIAPSAVLPQAGQQQAGQLERVERRAEDLHALPFEERRVERGVLADDRIEPDELLDLGGDAGEMRRGVQLRRIDMRQHRDAVLELAFRVHERLVGVEHAARVEADRGDFDDLVGVRIEPGRLEIERNIRHGEGRSSS